MPFIRRCVVVAFLCTVPCGSSAGGLVPLPGMLSSCSFLCGGGFGFEECLFPDFPGEDPPMALNLEDEELYWESQTCIQPGLPPFEDLFFTGLGDAQTEKGVQPYAQASATAMSDSDPATGTALSGDFSSRARLEYFARVEQDATPPFDPGQVPVTIEARFSSLESGPCGNGGDVDVLRGSTILLAWNPGAGDPPISVDALLRVNDLVFFGLSAIATAFTGFGELFTVCTAITDPLVTFDQERFDEEWGAASFPLADYYAFRSAADAEVPEPGAALQLAVGAALLVAAARRSRRRSVSPARPGRPRSREAACPASRAS